MSVLMWGRVWAGIALLSAAIVTPVGLATAEESRPNVVLIVIDDKYGQGIVNREFLSENKVFYHQSVESALAAI